MCIFTKVSSHTQTHKITHTHTGLHSCNRLEIGNAPGGPTGAPKKHAGWKCPTNLLSKSAPPSISCSLQQFDCYFTSGGHGMLKHSCRATVWNKQVSLCLIALSRSTLQTGASQGLKLSLVWCTRKPAKVSFDRTEDSVTLKWKALGVQSPSSKTNMSNQLMHACTENEYGNTEFKLPLTMATMLIIQGKICGGLTLQEFINVPRYTPAVGQKQKSTFV